MRSLLKLLVAVAVAVPAIASAQIANTKHNLSAGAPATNTVRATTETQICKFCHAPHGVGAANQVLLWNRAASTGAGFAAGTTTTSGTALPNTNAQLGAPSLACLSCHDGVAGLGNVTAGGPIAMTGTMTTGAIRAADGSLNGNHPISVNYPGLGTTYLGNAIGTNIPAGTYNVPPTAAANIRLFGTTGQQGIECGSCHNAHGASNGAGGIFPFFLRSTNAGSALCLACHNK